ncbi:hypothetical protein [Kitasatospora paranensis]|uniref:hypothetical protein n=1 Tax=Kitasatospora paranensis TaxID=258053 RepID=UPI003CD0AEB5
MAALHREADVCAVQGLAGGPLDRAGAGGGHREHGQDEPAHRPQQQSGAGRLLLAEQPEHHGRAGRRVDRPGQQRAGGRAQRGQQQEREGQAADQGADVVGGGQIGHRPAGVLPADLLDQRHQQGDLGADQHADQERGGGEPDRGGVQPVQPGPAGVQREDRESAGQRQRALDQGEGGCGTAGQPLGEQRPDAHREDHHRQHHRGLGDRVAQQVSGDGDQFELVHQPAGGADERGEQDQGPGQSPPRARR